MLKRQNEVIATIIFSVPLIRIGNTFALITLSIICTGDVFTFAPNYYLFVLLLAVINGCYSIRLINLADALIALASSFYVMGVEVVTFRELITFPVAILSLYGLGFLIGHLLVNSEKFFHWRFNIAASLQILLYYLLVMFLFRDAYTGVAYWGLAGFGLGYLMLVRSSQLLSIAGVFMPFWLLFIALGFVGGLVHWITGSIIASVSGIFFAKIAYHQRKEVAGFLMLANFIFCAWVIPLLSENMGYTKTVTASNDLVPEDRFLYGHDTIRLEAFKGKILVLDFWHTRCGSCFKKFPELEQLQKKYEKNGLVKIMAVNIPIREDTLGEAKAKMASLGYTFDNIYALANTTASAMGVSAYPAILYVDRNNKIRYKGQLELNRRIFQNTEALIEKLLDGS